MAGSLIKTNVLKAVCEGTYSIHQLKRMFRAYDGKRLGHLRGMLKTLVKQGRLYHCGWVLFRPEPFSEAPWN